MNRLHLTMVVVILLTIAACKKNVTADKISPDTKTSNVVEECQPLMYSLVVDSITGASYIFKVLGSPGAGPVSSSPYVVSGTNQLKLCGGGGAPILYATGLAYDPSTSTFYGTTGNAGPFPNSIFLFTDPNCVTIKPAINVCGIMLDLSDLERDQTTGTYYAINRGTSAPHNRIVKLGLPGTLNVTCLPNPLPVGLNARGLTFNCNGAMYVMHTTGNNGIIVFVDKVTGLNGPSFAYPGPIASSAAVATPDLGLHFDCTCIGRFITASFNPYIFPTRMTDGMPSGLGSPVYNFATGVLKPTVDFARP